MLATPAQPMPGERCERALLSFGANLTELYRRVADCVAEIRVWPPLKNAYTASATRAPSLRNVSTKANPQKGRKFQISRRDKEDIST
jgi:hypothetical protein